MKSRTLMVFAIIILSVCAFAFWGCKPQKESEPLVDEGLEEQDATEKHEHSFPESLVMPTCTEGGYILHECECGYSYKTDESEPLGHKLGTVYYSWNWDYSACTALSVCSACKEAVTETAPATKTEVFQTAFHPVYSVYVTFQNDAFVAQEDLGVIIHSFDLEIESEEFLVREVSCNNKGEYYKSCACGTASKDTFTTEKLAHKVVCGRCEYCERTDVICEHYDVDEILLNKVEGLTSPALCSCDECDEKFYKDLTPGDIDMPIIYLDSSVFEANSVDGVKNTVEDVGIKYTSVSLNFEDTCSVKIQGSSSKGYPKKNYNIKLSAKVKLVDEWGKQKKYTLKANYVDFSQARNIVSAKLYGQIVHSRDIDDEYSGLVNGGAIDGYPVLVYVDNCYHGLYTMNIPKDKWLMGMKDSDDKNQAMLFTTGYTKETFLWKSITWEEETHCFEFEFYSNEESEIDDDFTWAVDGFNEMITFINSSTQEEFKRDLHNYTNVDRVLDAMIFAIFICGRDNLVKNIIWVTYDGGQTWQPNLYDMDDAWGLAWNGLLGEITPTFDCTDNKAINKLWHKMYTCFDKELKERYAELRKTILSYENIESGVLGFKESIYPPLLDLERTKWPDVPSNDVDHYEQMITWIEARMEYLDELWTPAEE